ncbi:MAG: hypothetical protein KDD62_09240 [Bdellovibrionales bacterium]|nr:hypothetical protein [Bdellovibrionales bacterium]
MRFFNSIIAKQAPAPVPQLDQATLPRHDQEPGESPRDRINRDAELVNAFAVLDKYFQLYREQQAEPVTHSEMSGSYYWEFRNHHLDILRWMESACMNGNELGITVNTWRTCLVAGQKVTAKRELKWDNLLPHTPLK